MSSEELVSVDFSQGKWNRDDWDFLVSSRWDTVGDVVQEADHIVNRTPAGATGTQLEGELCGETYISLMRKEIYEGPLTISSTMSFDYRMAPSLAFGWNPIVNSRGHLEHAEHLELVLFNQGVNVWHHFFRDGKENFHLQSFLRAPFEANTPYEFKASLSFFDKIPQLTLTVGGHTFGYLEPNLPKVFQVGLIASEGVNRFYDFKVTRG